jgi:ribonuclease-3
LQHAVSASPQSSSTQPALPAAHITVVRSSRSDLYSRLTEALGISVKDELLQLALTHRSYSYEHGGVPTNERLEFLGDSVLGLLITEVLFERFPDFDESKLSPLRSSVVNTRALATIARELELGQYLLIGKGEESTGGRDKNSLLADCLEALVGAIYLDHGYVATAECVLRWCESALSAATADGATLDGKTALQELAAGRGLTSPEYEIEESGPDHDKSFTAITVLGGERFPQGSGKSKREAEQVAAKLAYEILQAREVKP